MSILQQRFDFQVVRRENEVEEHSVADLQEIEVPVAALI